MPSDTTSWTVLAHLIRPQGRKGELLADLLTDFPERFAQRKDLFLVPGGFAGDPSSAKSIEVTSAWLPVGKNSGRVVLHLTGVDTITSAEMLAGMEIAVTDDHRIPLEEDSTYISDLIGCTVFDESIELGRITDVQFPTAPDGSRLADAPALLAVRSNDGEEILVPYVKAFIKTIDLPAKRLVMRLPAGLTEANRQA